MTKQIVVLVRDTRVFQTRANIEDNCLEHILGLKTKWFYKRVAGTKGAFDNLFINWTKVGMPLLLLSNVPIFLSSLFTAAVQFVQSMS